MFPFISFLKLSFEGRVSLLLLWQLDMAGISENKNANGVRRKKQRLPLFMGDDGSVDVVAMGGGGGDC